MCIRDSFEILRKTFPDLTKQEVREAADAAYAEYANHMALLRKEGGRMMERARAEGRRIIVLAGRPYHVDPEINHGIDTLITQFGAAVVTEDSVSDQVERFPTTVLNQWTYHSRLYAAAKYCCCLLYTSCRRSQRQHTVRPDGRGQKKADFRSSEQMLAGYLQESGLPGEMSGAILPILNKDLILFRIRSLLALGGIFRPSTVEGQEICTSNML